MTVADQAARSDEFGVYVHWPFCASKCPYCDFNSHVWHTPVDQGDFVAAYRREIANFAELAPGRTVASVFFGGGTPSLMEAASVEAILDEIAARWAVADDVEISLEANPSSSEAERFRAYRAAGVNRLSIGVQSFDDARLRFLGRLHTSDEAIRAIAAARATFERISFDLIYATPGQAEADWRAELGRAIDLAADHLSLYQLTIEPHTPFFDLDAAGRLAMPEPEKAARFFELTQEITTTHGLPAYEISNHAAPGAQCRHNLTYWRGRDYVGVGPGAHGRLTLEAGRTATANHKNPELWRRQVAEKGHGLTERAILDRSEIGDEFLVMGLRLAEGIDPARYQALSGRSLSPQTVRFLCDCGLLQVTDAGRLRATSAGALVLNAVVAELAMQRDEPAADPRATAQNRTGAGLNS